MIMKSTTRRPDTFLQRVEGIEQQLESISPRKVDDYPGELGNAYMSLLVSFRHFRKLAQDKIDSGSPIHIDWITDRATQVEIEFKEPPKPALVGKQDVSRHIKTSFATLDRLLAHTNFPRHTSASTHRIFFDLGEVDAWMKQNPKTFQRARHDLL